MFGKYKAKSKPYTCFIPKPDTVQDCNHQIVRGVIIELAIDRYPERVQFGLIDKYLINLVYLVMKCKIPSS